MESANKPIKKTLRLWSKAYKESSLSQNILFNTVMDLLREALRCHDVIKAYIAATILCRAAIEAMLSALIFYKKREKSYEFNSLLWGSMKNKRKKYGPSLTDLIEYAHKHGMLDNKQLQIANKIIKIGNFSAHLAERIEDQRFITCGEKEIRLWVEESESYQTLSSTINLLRQLSRKVKNI